MGWYIIELQSAARMTCMRTTAFLDMIKLLL